MRQLYCSSVLMVGLFVGGCGQSGALHLPSDPDYDKRAKYLIYRDPNAKGVEQQKRRNEDTPASVDAELKSVSSSD